MKAGRMIKSLRRQIPKFKCVPGCTDCCGPQRWSKWEWNRLSIDKRKELSEIKCLFKTADGCSVYKDRPIICRLFGVVDVPIMRCLKGVVPQRTLTKEEGDRIMMEYRTTPCI